MSIPDRPAPEPGRPVVFRNGLILTMGNLQQAPWELVPADRGHRRAGLRGRRERHVAFQAQRGDVHTVMVDGRLVKHGHRLVGVDLAAARHAAQQTVEYLAIRLGAERWAQGMHPDVPPAVLADNPYTYTARVTHPAARKR